jgi:hypothetical protein
MTRKEATKKMGKYAALTALGSFVILSCKNSQCQSPEETYKTNTNTNR